MAGFPPPLSSRTVSRHHPAADLTVVSATREASRCSAAACALRRAPRWPPWSGAMHRWRAPRPGSRRPRVLPRLGAAGPRAALRFVENKACTAGKRGFKRLICRGSAPETLPGAERSLRKASWPSLSILLSAQAHRTVSGRSPRCSRARGARAPSVAASRTAPCAWTSAAPRVARSSSAAPTPSAASASPHTQRGRCSPSRSFSIRTARRAAAGRSQQQPWQHSEPKPTPSPNPDQVRHDQPPSCPLCKGQLTEAEVAESGPSPYRYPYP